MDKKIIILIVGLVIVGGLIGAFVLMQPKAKETSSTPTSQTSTSDNSSSNSEATPIAEIDYTNSGFSPKELTVKKGTTVKVVNNSDGPLQFSSADHPTHTKDPELNMSMLDPGKSGMVTVDKVGSNGYHNHLKPSDTGTIIVTE